ncbi:MAG TPA: SDR family NAD(P)-dependent oxidoreductase [Bacteroidetes bacterium]|nr:SDR family NAD(P)-dependent oxidoreductase [Bacteroidota bacterium]
MNKGKETVWITGASAGIGMETALLLAETGYQLILSSRRKKQLEDLSEKILRRYGTSVQVVPLDVTERKEVEKAVRGLPEDWAQVDILINNAGLAAGLDHLQEGDINDWERMIDTNIKGLLYMTRSLLPGMAERGRGHVVNLGSIAGKEVYERGNVYCATKHAVDALSRAMRIDLLGRGIRVTNIAPGLVETEFSLVRFKGDTRKAKDPYRGMTPLGGRDVAEAILFAITRPPHVCINDLVITPTAQANSFYVKRNS